MQTFIKDPDAVLDYKNDWSAWLGDDTIAASIWTASSDDIAIDSSNFDDTTTTPWISGGIVGQSYIITNHIVTVGGREDDRSFKIKCKNL